MKRILHTFLLLTLSTCFVLSARAATYTSANSGAWTVSTNWSPNGTPGPNDDVFIDHAITRTGGSYSGSGSITIRTNGTLTIATDFTISGSNGSNLMDLVVQGTGVLVINGRISLSDHSVFTMSAGAATVSSMTAGGGSYVGNGGTLTISTNGLTITSAGGSSFVNNSSGNILVNTGSNTGDVSAAKFTNAGTFTVANTGGDFTFENSGGAFSNTGTISVAGAFTANAAITNDGTLSTGTFTMQNTGGTFTNRGTVTVSGVTNINGATIQLSPSATGHSRMTVRGVLNMQGWGGFNVGNGVPGSPARYADLVIEANLGQSAGSINVKCNGRVAIFSDFNISNGNFTIEACSPGVGGQVYVDGDGLGSSVTQTGGSISNNNNPVSGVPYGFYVNGSTSGSVPAAGTVSQMQTSNPDFFNWVAGLPGSPLPVKLQYFKVTKVNDRGISLEWATSMEKNFSHFELQRAGTDLLFSPIGIIQGKGVLEVKTVYSFLDDAPAGGKNYYRLKAIDLDNTFEYFNVIVADWTSTARELSLYPNPVVDHTFTVEIGDTFDQPVSLVVYEARGYVVCDSVVKGNLVTVRLPDTVAPGIYFARVSSSSKQQVVRVVVK